MRIPITFPFHDPPAQEKRYKEERERREMRFGDRVGGQLLEKASGEMREDFSSPRTNPVPISRLYSPNTMSAPSPQHHRHEDAMRDLELNAHLRRDDLNGFNSFRAEATDVRIPITFPFIMEGSGPLKWRRSEGDFRGGTGGRLSGQLSTTGHHTVAGPGPPFLKYTLSRPEL